jgi:hypothetical protein
MSLSIRRAGVAAAVGVAVVAAGAAFWFAGSSGCSSHDDVTARVAVVSSALQEKAAQGKLSVEELAGGIKRVNEAATAYETTKDAQAYCEALDKLSAEYASAE